MIKKMRLRFILYTMLVITVIILLIAGIIFLGTNREISHHRTALAVIIILVLVFIGSIYISGFAIKPIKKAWQQQLDFTADASHELRTPLAVIRSNLEIVLEHPEKQVKEQEKWLNNVFTETERMSKLVEELLTLSKADTGEQNRTYQGIPLSILVNDRICAYAAMAEKQNIQLVNRVPESLEIAGDPFHISRLFSILIDNAIKHMNRPGSLVVSGYQKGRHINMEFSDNGEGIAEDDLNSVFMRFYRGDKSRSRKKDGFGLGLSIAKLIVENHNGSISVSSSPGVGTSVKIIFKSR